MSFTSMSGLMRPSKRRMKTMTPREGVVLAVEDQGLERGVRVALGRGDAVHYLLEHGGDVDALLG